MTPLNTYLEYAAARKVVNDYERRINIFGISVNDAAEYLELKGRVERYEANPTLPNIISAEKGNVDQNQAA